MHGCYIKFKPMGLLKDGSPWTNRFAYLMSLSLSSARPFKSEHAIAFLAPLMIGFAGVRGGEQVSYEVYGQTGNVRIPCSLRSFIVLHRSRRCMEFEGDYSIRINRRCTSMHKSLH